MIIPRKTYNRNFMDFSLETEFVMKKKSFNEMQTIYCVAYCWSTRSCFL